VDIKKLDRELCGDIWSGDTMDDLLREIASFGHRFTGSEGEKKAQKAVIKRLKKWGLRTRLQRFKVSTWERGPSRLSIPSKKIELPCLGMVYTGTTGGKSRSYEVVDLLEGTPGDFKRNKASLRGKAVLFSKKDYLEREKKMGPWRYKTAVDAGAKAFIVGTFRWPGVISAGTLRLDENGFKPVPAVTVSGESVAILKRAMASGANRISLTAKGKNVNRTTGNVIAELPGKRKDQAIVLGAHLDSFDISTGADDNGTGVAVISEVARLLSAHKVELERPVRFVYFTGEELGRLGSIKYAESVEPADVGVYFNFDLPTNGGFPALLTQMEKSDPVFWSRLQDKMSYRFHVREILAQASDHYSFYVRGIPCIWEASRNSGSRGPASLHHTAHDNLEYIHPNELKDAATMAVKIVLYLARLKRLPFKHFEPLPKEKVPHFS
jgi:Iap family predicted aminopeptidase